MVAAVVVLDRFQECSFTGCI